MRGKSLLMVVALFGLACGQSRSNIVAFGAPCSPNATESNGLALCATGVCVALDSASGLCTLACTEDSDCGDGYICQGAGRYGRVCQPIRGCKTDTDCPSGHSCNPDTGNCYIRVSRSLCSPCQDGKQCPEGGACFSAIGSGEQFCTVACGEGDSCPMGYACTSIPAGDKGAVIKQCAPVSQSCNAGRPLCAPCAGDNECGGPFDTCVRNVVSNETFCGKDCNPKKNVCPAGQADCVPEQLDSALNPDCPESFSCTNLGQNLGQGGDATTGPYQCVPNSNTCIGYCDAASEADELRQCGLGQRCVDHRCTPSTDGRECSPCTTSDDCRSGAHPENRCLVNDCPDCPFKGESFCATPCGDDAACAASFGPGFVCQTAADSSTGQTRKYCMPQRGTCASGLGRLGDDCSRNGASDCVNGVCLKLGIHSLCSLACHADADCADSRYHCCESSPNGYDCSPEKRTPSGPKSGSGVCAPAGGLFGDDCSPGRPPCQTATCLDLGTAQVCSASCSLTACPENFTCRKAQLPNMSGELDVCFPSGGGGPGANCSFGPAACASGLCIRKASGPVCTQPCSDGVACPDGWSCQLLSTVLDTSVEACLPPELIE